METGKSFRAVYRDSQNRTYSAPVVKLDGQWQMVTSEGSEPIVAQFQDDIAGPLVFDSYREVESDQLHVTPGSNWSDQKRAFAEQQMAKQRKTRDQGRNEVQNVPVDAKDVALIAAAREHNQQIAHAMRPNGTGAGVIIEKA